MITDLFSPTQHGRRVLFDFLCIHDPSPQVRHLERLAYLIGIYVHILTRHKMANRELMRRSDRRRVLYLRGYDFDSAVRVAGRAAMSTSTLDTQLFTSELDFADDASTFMVMSPRDIYWETSSTQNYFYDLDRLVRSAVSIQPRAFFFNASDWKAGVKCLLDRMDHYVVYVSSITESILWEISQLDTRSRRNRVTIVFDESAIEKKEGQLHLQASLQHEHEALWTKRPAQKSMTASAFRKELTSRFFVTTPDAFSSELDHHKQRIVASRSKLPPGKREHWCDFRFAPSLPEEHVRRLRSLSAASEAFIRNECRSGIRCLPLLLAHTQLRIFMTLLMGAHEDCGRALARYQAIMQSTLEYYEPPEPRIAALSSQNKEEHALQGDRPAIRHDETVPHQQKPLIAVGGGGIVCAHKPRALLDEKATAGHADVDALCAGIAKVLEA